MIDHRRRALVYASVPLIVPLAVGVSFAILCNDDWCTGARTELLGYGLAFGLIVLGTTRWVSRRLIAAWRAALAGWAAGLGVFSFLFSASQFLEGDLMVAMVWLWLGGALLMAAIVLGRPKRPSDAGDAGSGGE